MIGIRLGPYELVEELGRGGMATVYRAYQPAMDRFVAVKVIDRALAAETASVERFQREARLIARLEHPHILPVYDFDGTHSPPYIVMRYLPGGTLRHVLGSHDEKLSCLHVVHLLQQVAAALDYAHRQGIIHRDIKPSNIMVDAEGHAFLTDFGIARLVLTNEPGLTHSGAVLGTPDYMAPEQAVNASEAGPSADLYALAVVAFEALTGVLPFESPTPMGMVVKQIHENPPHPSERNSTLPPAVDGVLLRGLAKQPSQRYATAGELTDSLAAAFGAPAATPVVATQTRPVPRRTATQRPGGGSTLGTQSEQNRLVTVVYVNAAEFAEVVEEASGAEGARRAQTRLWERAREAVNRFEGSIVTEADTGLLALWGAETTREDDAERAVRAALEIRDASSRLGITGSPDEPLPIRIGVHTGLALLTPTPTSSGTGSSYSATGATVSIATRIAERAEGEILITHDTFREVRGVFDLQPAEPIKVRGRGADRAQTLLQTYRVLVAKARSFRVGVRGVEGVETGMVGRRAELQLLENAFLDAFEDRETHVVTLLGGAGLGKSRLLDEFDKWADLRPERYFIFRGRATSATTASPYALLRNVLSFRFEILETDAPATVVAKLERGVAALLRKSEPDPEMAHLIGHLVGFDVGSSPYIGGLAGDPRQLAARSRQLFVRFFAQLGTVDGILLAVEDVHNADDASLDLLHELVMTERNLPFLVVYLARPGLLERRPTWGSGEQLHRRITLEPLDRHDSRELAREILKKIPEVPRVLRDLLVDRAEGNPLFMEELVKMLLEDRVVVKESDDVWRVEPTRVDHLRVPPTLAGLLQARLDTLLFPERLTLQRAAVIGRVFSDSALKAMDAADAPSAHVADLPAVLGRLEERGFLRRSETSSLEGGVEYAFAQNMLRDLIYDSLLRRALTTCHAAVAGWLASSQRADELLPLIAEHHERAGQTDRAMEFLARAGDRARKICAFTEATAFYRRALVLATTPRPAHPTPAPVGPTLAAPGAAPPVDAGRSRVTEAGLRLSLGEVYRLLGSYSEAQTHLEGALTLARAASDAQATAAALYQASQVASVQGDYPRAQALLDESLPLARATGNAETLAQVLYGLGDLLWRSARHDEAAPTLEESRLHARLAGDATTEMYALNRLGSVAMFQKRLEDARSRFEEGRELARSAGNRERLVAFLNNLGEIERLGGSFAAARDLYLETLAINREIGRRDVETVLLSNLAAVSMKLGQPEEALGYAREALRLANEIGLTRMMVGALILFAQLEAQAGHQDRALDLLGLVLAHPAADADLREYLAPTLEELSTAMPQTAVAASLAVGRSLNFEATVKSLLEG